VICGYRIEPLAAHHNRSSFSSGVDALDHYLKRQASQDVRKRVTAIFVLTTDGTTIAGYYSLSASVIRLADLPDDITGKLPRYPEIPATLLGRLAVSLSFQGQGVGQLLLLDALRRVLVSTQQIASAMVIVDAKNDVVRNFYLRHNFISLTGHLNRLFLPVADIEKMFASGQ